MPRAFDFGTPQQDHNPLAGLLNFEEIDDAVLRGGNAIKEFLDSLLDGVVDFIYQLTGINLSSWDAFLSSLVDGKGIDLPWVIEGVQWLLGVFENLFNGLGVGGILPTPDEFWGGIIETIMNPLGVLEDLFARDRLTSFVIGLGNVLDDIPMIGDDLEEALLRLFNVRQKAVSADNRSTQQSANLSNLFEAPFDVDPGDFNPVETFLKGPVKAAQDAVDDFVSFLGGAFGSFFSRDDYREVANTTATQLQTLAAAVASLQQAAGDTANGGNSYLVDFTPMPDSTNMPAEFTTGFTGSGTGQTFGIIDGKAHFTNEGVGDRVAFNYYTAGATESDYQLIGAVFMSKPGKRFVPGPLPWDPHAGSETFYSSDELIGRRRAGVHSVRLRRFGDNTLDFMVDTGGTVTVLTTATVNWKANTAYYLQCGTPGNIRTFRLLEGASLTPVWTYTDNANKTLYGPDYRLAGFACERYQDTNGSAVSAFMLRDNIPSTVLGTMGRVYRTTAASGSSIAADTPRILIGATMTTIDYKTADLAYSAGTDEIHTITITGAPTAGTWQYTLNGETTTALAITASITTVGNAIRALPGVGAGGVVITGGPGAWIVTFTGSKINTNMGVPSVSHTFTGGTSPGISVVRTQVGSLSSCWTVSKKGNYMLVLKLDLEVSTASAVPLLYVNGTLRRRGGRSTNEALAAWTIPLEPDDFVQAGVETGSATGILGGPGGDVTYFEILKVG